MEKSPNLLLAQADPVTTSLNIDFRIQMEVLIAVIAMIQSWS
jgi:hypothetical protein